MHHLSIDLETYSSVPIAKAGAQKYISSPDFEILLFAYSVDGAPVEIIDLARGERLPPWLVQAITSPEYIKHAYNAPFEWGCLSKFLGTLPPDQWRCTMFHGLYCGYTAGLDATGKAWGLLRTSASSTPARRSSVIFASLAPLQRPMEAAPATCPSTTPISGSCSKNTAARML